MAATACAYGYQQGAPPPQKVLLPDTFVDVIDGAAQQQPAEPWRMPSRKVMLSDTFDDVVDGAVQQQPAEPAPPPPPPPLPRPAKVPPSTLSLQLALCTEGLGSESSGDIDLADLADDVSNDGDDDVALTLPCKRQHRERRARPAFPPPISVIGAGGKPWMYLRPQRGDGRLVLRELIIPSRELLHAHREDGWFKLQVAQPQPDHEPAQTQPDQDPADANGMAPEKTKRWTEYEQ